jgi:hypothetical protein
MASIAFCKRLPAGNHMKGWIYGGFLTKMGGDPNSWMVYVMETPGSSISQSEIGVMFNNFFRTGAAPWLTVLYCHGSWGCVGVV